MLLTLASAVPRGEGDGYRSLSLVGPGRPSLQGWGWGAGEADLRVTMGSINVLGVEVAVDDVTANFGSVGGGGAVVAVVGVGVS